jgi:hypothetical protein
MWEKYPRSQFLPLCGGTRWADRDRWSRYVCFPRTYQWLRLDIANIGLTDLRSRVTIIPQDPTILSGTIRSTLDVFDEYDDADIYAALKRVHLLKEDDDTTGTVMDDEERNLNVFKDLSNPVSEGGDNFSTGEKQLIWYVFSTDPGQTDE